MRSPLLPFGALLLLVVHSASAQLRRPDQFGREPRPGPAVSLLAGPAPYDAVESGTGTSVALRFEFPTSRTLLIEPGISWFRYRPAGGDRISYLLPELSVQLQAPLPAVRPYVGGGIGFSEFLDGRGKSFLTLHAAVGVRVAVGGGFGLRAEARGRTIDPFKLKAVDLGVGLSYRLGRRG